MLIGRGENFAWTLTSPEVDIVDTYAERLCGGSRTRYRYKGRCRRMETVKAGTIEKGGERVNVKFRRTVHGPVTGYARVAGSKRVVALARKRSSYGRETVDQIFFQRLTFGRVKSAADFIAAAKTTPQTFNAFYASDSEIAFYTTGRVPLHRKGVNPDLPVDGRGRNEWRGFLPGSGHPQSVNPPSGLLVNWNNKPAPDFPASDSRFGQEGPVTRVRLLLRELARQPKHTLASVLAAENAGATGDPRTFLWPTISAVLAAGEAPSPLAAAMAAALDRWAAADGGWIDARRRRERGRRRPGGHRRRVERSRRGGAVRAPGAEAVPAARGPQPALRRAAGQQPVRRLAPVHGQGPACAARPPGRRPLPHALLRQGERHARARRASGARSTAPAGPRPRGRARATRRSGGWRRRRSPSRRCRWRRSSTRTARAASTW